MEEENLSMYINIPDHTQRHRGYSLHNNPRRLCSRSKVRIEVRSNKKGEGMILQYENEGIIDAEWGNTLFKD